MKCQCPSHEEKRSRSWHCARFVDGNTNNAFQYMRKPLKLKYTHTHTRSHTNTRVQTFQRTCNTLTQAQPTHNTQFHTSEAPMSFDLSTHDHKLNRSIDIKTKTTDIILNGSSTTI